MHPLRWETGFLPSHLHNGHYSLHLTDEGAEALGGLRRADVTWVLIEPGLKQAALSPHLAPLF